MSRVKPNSASEPDVPLSIALPTEAEIRAADLEQDDAALRETLAQREARIREAAYAKAQQRGFVPGHEEEDWLEAERTVDRENVAPPVPPAPAKR